jgi:hypothetical protein
MAHKGKVLAPEAEGLSLVETFSASWNGETHGGVGVPWAVSPFF